MEGLQVEARVEHRDLSKSKIVVGLAVPESIICSGKLGKVTYDLLLLGPGPLP